MKPDDAGRWSVLVLALLAACGSKDQPPSVALKLSTNSVVFTAAAGQSPAAQTVTASGEGKATLAVPTVSVAGATWLAAAVSGAASPYTLTLTPSTSALASGSYTATVTVASAGATSSPQDIAVALTIAAAATPTISLTPASLTFSATAGAGNPAAQPITVGNSGTGTLAAPTATISYTSGSGWLTASVSGSAAPYTVTVSAATGSLAAGSYAATLSLASAGASNTPQTVAVTFNVAAAGTPTMGLSPTSLGFSATAGGANPLAQTVSVSNAGSGSLAAPTATISYTTGAGWLSAAVSGSAAPYTVTVSAVTGSLAAGTYTASISLASAGAGNTPQAVPVTFTVSTTPGTPFLGISPAGLDFTATVGGSNPAAQTIGVANLGGGTLATPTLAISYISGSGWLNATVSGTSAPFTITVTATTGSLAKDIYGAILTITSVGATTSPRQVPITFTVSTPGVPEMDLSRSSLSFNADPGGPDPSERTFDVDNIGGGTLALPTVTIAYTSGSGWLSTSVAGTDAPYEVTVTATTGSLTTGAYQATLAVSSTGALSSPQNVAVTFTVNPPPTLAFGPTSITFDGKNGEADPEKTWVDIHNSGKGTLGKVTATVSYASVPGWLTVLAYQDGSPNLHQVAVEATTGSLPVGTYTATITLTCAAAVNSPQTIPVTFNVTAGTPAMGFYPTNLEFKTNYQSPGDLPPQEFKVFNVGGGTLAPPTVQINYNTGSGWLSTTVSGTSAPYTVTATVSRAAVNSSGGYNAYLSITSPGAALKIYGVSYFLNFNAYYAVHGTLKYESVPPTANGLDYGAIVQKPIRHALVEVLDAPSNTVNYSTYSGDDGSYLIFYPSIYSGQSKVRVSASARDFGQGAEGQSIDVKDNTAGNAVYEMTSPAFTEADKVVDMVATTGWGGSSYTGPRLAAPFAILDAAYAAGRAFLDARPTLIFRLLVINWSANNRPEVGDKAAGQIGASHWDPAAPNGGQLYFLGKQDVDTDEFDSHVVIREWGKYFEARVMGRADSPGGAYASADAVDPRLAWSEGWRRALAAVVLDGQFKETSGPGQGQGLAYSLEDNTAQDPNPGWWSVRSVEHIVYDVFDAANEGHDGVALGMGGLADALIKKQKITPAAATLFSFIRGLKALNADQSAAIEALVAHRSVLTTGGTALSDDWGTGETRDGGDPNNLPLYRQIKGGVPATTLTFDGTQPSNGLGQNRFFFACCNGATVISTCAKDIDLYGFDQGKLLGTAATSSGNEKLSFFNGFSGRQPVFVVVTGRDQGGSSYTATVGP